MLVFLDPIAARINRSRQLPPRMIRMSEPGHWFTVFSLGRAALITDNGVSKAAPFGETMRFRRADSRDGAGR